LLLYSPGISNDIQSFEILPWSHSDHLPLLVQTRQQTGLTSRREQLSTRPKLIMPTVQQDCADFSTELDSLLDPYNLTGDVDVDFAALKETVYNLCMKRNCFKKQVTFTPKAKWFDSECATLGHDKDRALRALRRASGAAQLRALIATYNDLNRKYKSV